MKNIKYLKEKYITSFRNCNLLYLTILIGCLTACESFLEIDPPKDKLIFETVFEDSSLVEAALANIYYKMREQSMVSGSASGLSALMGIYADEFDYIGTNDDRLRFFNHNVTAVHPTVSAWWSQAYNLIYAANDLIKGVENSSVLSIEEKVRFKGHALFVRGYLHSLLVVIYGDIPYINTTNYLENNVVAPMPVTIVYEHIIADLTLAINLLDDASGERIYPNKSAARALLARMYLYTENWGMAAATATDVIDVHTLESDVSKVFLKDSPETLWQFKPGDSPRNTEEARVFVIKGNPTIEGFSLTDSLLEAFELNDSRRSNWVGFITDATSTDTLYFAYKYKEFLLGVDQPSLEYSIVFRLAELYLIRAEARAQLGEIVGAQEDLNTIRNRADLANTTAATTNTLLDAILQERQVELFTEHAQRWFDLKRTGNAAEVLAPIKPNWRQTGILFPIPDTELLVNPNLTQNEGY
ncbi:MAG: RagB/SusD family nutrient uptake outer membrane protein [Algibacter sp.]